VTHLRQAMLEELQRRNYATTTIYYYLKAVEQFAKYFHTSPDQLNQSHLRRYQAYLLRERKLGPRTVKLHVSALRFFFVKTLKRPYMLEDIPFPKVPRRLPAILTTDEVTRLIDGARNLTDRTMLMVLYSTGMRNAELRHLQVRDIDIPALAYASRARQGHAVLAVGGAAVGRTRRRDAAGRRSASPLRPHRRIVGQSRSASLNCRRHYRARRSCRP
jgi:integrase/recombinase XerD